MIDYTSHYTVRWHVYHVNEDTWDEDFELPGIVSASLDRDCTDDVPLLETSSITCFTSLMDDFRDGYYRIIAEIEQGSSFSRIPMTTQLYRLSDEMYDYVGKEMTLRGQSVLLPSSEIMMRDGVFVPKDSNGAEWVLRQLRTTVKAPVILEGDGYSLKRHIVYDSNDTILSAIWGVLDAGKWCLQIDGNGVIHIVEKPKDPKVVISAESTRLLHPEVKRSVSKENIPNRYIVRNGFTEYVAVNDDPTSETSTVSVGRYVDSKIDTNPYLMTGESIQEYAKRKLEEESTVSIPYNYTREYYPELYPMDLITVQLRDMRIDDDLRIVKQQFTLDKGINVSETANKEQKYWRRS